MAGYRFCRSDDIPLLVAAHNACWVPHFGAEQAMTVESFKRGVRELGLWASSCMVAFADDEPIGILIGAKRDRDANCVHRLAIRPGYERLGHGRHLLTSLANKSNHHNVSIRSTRHHAEQCALANSRTREDPNALTASER